MLTSIDIPATQRTDVFDVMSEGFQILMVTLSIFMEHLNMEILLAIPLNSCVENSYPEKFKSGSFFSAKT